MPTVTGPIAGGTPDVPMNAMPTALKNQYGYSEREYLFAGTASAYEPTGTWGQDGKWNVTPATTAAYKSRLLVRAPTDPKKFNGTVVVEWLNQTPGRDADWDFAFAHAELLRDGFAYVGVSAQALGINGPSGLKMQNPARYRGLVHPGDDYSYDIFSQAAQALWRPKGSNPLGTLHPRHVIATGESQSALLMVTYVNAIAPIANLYDGFMIHSRGNSGAAINTASSVPMPKVAHVRADLRRPVMTIETETDLFWLGFYQARQPDSTSLRTWEMAGTAHGDQSALDYAIASQHVWSRPDQNPDAAPHCGRVNEGPQRYIVSAGFAALNTWVADGTLPAAGQPLTIEPEWNCDRARYRRQRHRWRPYARGRCPDLHTRRNVRADQKRSLLSDGKHHAVRRREAENPVPNPRCLPRQS